MFQFERIIFVFVFEGRSKLSSTYQSTPANDSLNCKILELSLILQKQKQKQKFATEADSICILLMSIARNRSATIQFVAAEMGDKRRWRK